MKPAMLTHKITVEVPEGITLNHLMALSTTEDELEIQVADASAFYDFAKELQEQASRLLGV